MTNFGTIGEATVDMRMSTAKLNGDLAQTAERIKAFGATLEQAVASGRGFETLSAQARTLAPAIADMAKSGQSFGQIIAQLSPQVTGAAATVQQLAQQFGGLAQAGVPAGQTLANVTAATAPAAQGLRNVQAAAAGAGGAIGSGGGGGGGGVGLAGAAGSAGGAFGVLNASLSSFAGYLGALAVRKVVGDLEALGSTAVSDAEDWQLAATKIQFSLQLTREAALRERDALAQASKSQPLGATFQLATFLGPSLLELGRTRGELNGLVQELGQLSVVSGSTGQQSQRAFYELGRAFAYGGLQGQPLRALMMDMPALFEAIVAGSGKSREELIALSHEVGGIPMGLVVDALEKQAPVVGAAYARMGTDVTRGLTDIKNAFEEAVGRSAEAVGAVNSLGAAFASVADFMRSDTFQTALGPFAGFVHDLGDGLKATVEEMRTLLAGWTAVKAAATGAQAGPDLSTFEGRAAHASSIEQGLAHPPPVPTPGLAEKALVTVEGNPFVIWWEQFQQRHLFMPSDFGGDPSKAVPVYDAVGAVKRAMGGTEPAALPPDLSSHSTTPERFAGGPAPEAHGPGLSPDEQAQLAADIGAILQRAAAADPAGPRSTGEPSRPAKVEMVASTEHGPIDRLQAFLANMLAGGGMAGEAATTGGQVGAWLRGREGPQAGPGTLEMLAKAFPQPFDVGGSGKTVAEAAPAPVTLSAEQWKALAGLNFLASIHETPAASPVEPITAFHGSPHKFQTFDPARIGDVTDDLTGYHFSSSQKYASDYATGRDPQLYGVQLKVDPAQLLDFQKTFAQQTPYVRDRVAPLGAGDVDPKLIMGNWFGDFADKVGGERSAAGSLQQAGIPGYTYKDMGPRGPQQYAIFPGEESRIGITSVNGQPVQRTPAPAAGTGLPGLPAALGLGAVGAASFAAGTAKAGEEEPAARPAGLPEAGEAVAAPARWEPPLGAFQRFLAQFATGGLSGVMGDAGTRVGAFLAGHEPPEQPPGSLETLAKQFPQPFDIGSPGKTVAQASPAPAKLTPAQWEALAAFNFTTSLEGEPGAAPEVPVPPAVGPRRFPGVSRAGLNEGAMKALDATPKPEGGEGEAGPRVGAEEGTVSPAAAAELVAAQALLARAEQFDASRAALVAGPPGVPATGQVGAPVATTPARPGAPAAPSATQQAELAAARRYDVPPTADTVSEQERMWEEERVRRARDYEAAPPAAATTAELADPTSRVSVEAQGDIARLREELAQGDAMLARARQADAAPETTPASADGRLTGSAEAVGARPSGLADEVRSAVASLLEGLKAAPGEVAQAWRDAAARTAPAPLGTPAAETAGSPESAAAAQEAAAAGKERVAADQETAAKAREGGAALEQAGQGAREAGAAGGVLARAEAEASAGLSFLKGKALELAGALGLAAGTAGKTPVEGGPGAKGPGGPPAASPEDQAGPTKARLEFAQGKVADAQAYAKEHPVGGLSNDLAAAFRAILSNAATGAIEKATQITAAERQQNAAEAADRAPGHAEDRSGSTPPIPGQEAVVRTQAELVKREADKKELAAQQEKLAYLKTLEQAALTNKVDSPERLSAIQADRAETQGKVTALIARERAQQLASFTGGSEQEATSAAGRIFDKTTTTNPRDAFALQLKQDKAAVGSAKAAGDTEGVSLANKTLLADQQKLAQYDQQRKDALASQREALTGQASATERLANDLEKIGRAQRTQPGDSGPALAKASDVASAKDAAYKRFAAGIEQEAGKDNQGKPERERAEAAIAALLAAETGHVGARAVLEERIAQIKGRVTELDKADLEKLEAQNATIEAAQAKRVASLSRLKAGVGGDIQGSIDDAREAAQSSVPTLTKEEAASTHGPEFEVRRDVQREQAGDTEAEKTTLTQRLAALKSVATAEYSYMEVVKEADARRKAGLITEQQYNRAVQGALTPLQAYQEEMARIGAVEANVNLAVLKGTTSLEERRRKMIQLDAEKGRAAAGERSSATKDLYDRGEAGSGVGLGSAIGGGVEGGALDFISQYGNAAKDAGQLTKTALEGASDALSQFALTGKADLAALATSLEQMAVKMTIQLLLARALGAALGPLMGGGGGGGAVPGGGGLLSQSGVAPAGFGAFMDGGFQGAAHGMAMDGGDPVPMATGGILSRETMIPMARGGYADAGEVPGDTEAVMPLKRNARGDLGVQTDAGGGGGGSAPSIVIHNHGEAVGQSDTKWDPDSRTLEVTIKKMVDGNIASGAHNRAMKTAFGLTPNVRR